MNGNYAQEPNVGPIVLIRLRADSWQARLQPCILKRCGRHDRRQHQPSHIKDSVEAFAEGAKYINPDAEVLTGYTESMTDIAKGEEMGMAFIEQGADVLLPMQTPVLWA